MALSMCKQLVSELVPLLNSANYVDNNNKINKKGEDESPE